MAETIVLPGLVDPHVHLRDPGQTHKEDFFSGTAAALAGGYTTVLDMPNNLEPITTPERLAAKKSGAAGRVVCDIGFHFGTLGDNLGVFEQVIDQVTGLKIYLNATTGNFIIDKHKLLAIYEAWPGTKPILLHAEDDVSDLVLDVVSKTKKPTHICHVSSRAELETVLKAKNQGLPVTAGVTPHHLFLTEDDQVGLGAYGLMKPSLKPAGDQRFLWEHFDAIDVIESDHAPHTRGEKGGPAPPLGVPGLETTLPLMLTAEAEGRLTRRQLIEKLHTNPLRIFGLTADKTTQVFVEMSWRKLRNQDLLTKSGWSPFAGRRVLGRVVQVDLRGQTVFKDGKVLANPGNGRLLYGGAK